VSLKIKKEIMNLKRN